MSIAEHLQALLDQKKLVAREMEDGVGEFRHVFLSPLVSQFLLGNPARFERVAGTGNLLFDIFQRGDEVTFRMNPEGRGGMVARNAPPSTGVCDFRLLAPDPQVRIFGCFAMRDHYVALTYAQRRLLAFSSTVANAKRQWDFLFPGFSPVVSEDVKSYVSEPVIVVV